MKVIGVIGGIGAGKSTVIEKIREYTATYVISADCIGHGILKKGQPAYVPVIETFGEGILDSKGEIVRKALGEIVFKDAKQLEKLNALTHPLICEEVERQINWCKKQAAYDFIVVEGALLLEVGLGKLMDIIIAVYADEETRIKRVMLREGFTKEQVLSRFKAQKKWEEFQEAADFVIDNGISLEKTCEQIKKIVVQF
ncbi:dephospho-CoA kinase [Sporanaerobium hydrogeniformans]|uniref:Dephospho-CoA kinase n=1 Tax=Sporanaerobium hydrogeniformans TaxID=3072179 RepID=A0AC61DFG6_9FIRM|nr:dephospho-CoA kinase [Sporanaerobium hydrogeniformans]PHV71451.1 dephospho-CoA kinase [Sporanaerobium hydrogeniformans]